MKFVLRIKDVDRWLNYGESDLPIAIGVSSQGTIVFGRMAQCDPAAWLELADHRMFLQPVDGPASTQFNGKELVRSTWLQAGDEIQIGETRLTVETDAGVVMLSPTSKRNLPVLTPPTELSTGQKEDRGPLPSDQVSTHAKPTENESSETRSEMEAPTTSSSDTETADTEQTQDDSPLPGEHRLGKERATEQVDSQPGDTEHEDFVPLPGTQARSRLRTAVILLFMFLLVCVTLVLIVAPVEVVISPAPDSILLDGFPPAVKVKDRYLALPGRYQLVAEKKGYHPLKEPFTVTLGSKPSLTYSLRKLPGLLDVVSQPVNGATVRIEGHIVGETPLSALELEAGRYRLDIIAERYLPATKTVEIQGLANKQTIEFTLQPGWGNLKIESEPEGADVRLNGKLVGQTPLQTEPMGGDYQLELKKAGWKPIHHGIRIDPGDSLVLPKLALQRMDGVLELTSEPPGARVMLNDEFRGVTPTTLSIVSDQDHQLALSMIGFKAASRSVRIEGEETKSINVHMEPEYGIVFILSEPADAKLTVDGHELEGPPSRRLSLTTVPHKIEVTKEAYESFSTAVTPTVGVSKRLNVELRSERQVKAEMVQPEIRTAEGQVLRRILLDDPVQFQIGTSRREQARRSNERLYRVELTRTFDISEKEVTNVEFQRFRQEHNSRDSDGFDLNEANQPATSVTWNHAAAYLNWLSQKDGLPPAYKEEEGTMVPVVPITTGYRLPTEAEWDFVARYEGGNREKPLRFPWGDGRNPPANSGNYADSSAIYAVPVTIEDYDDGFRVAAPVGTFPSNKVGLYDLGGNVSEWCHDYYDVYVGSESGVLRDPTGPPKGEYHVVRGASWRHGSTIELRLSYRNFAATSRNDLGFRIARYAEAQ